ncbi:MAG: nucleotidyltransferase family protein [Acetobacteraceae bacterium]
MGYPRLSERKAIRTAEKRAAVKALKEELAAYARARGGRYLLYGSAARGEVRYDSDIDLLVDFPCEFENAAWNFAEQACAERGVDPDLNHAAWCRKKFLDHIALDVEVLG